MKTRIDVIATEESFKNLSTFSDIEDMNKTVRTYKDAIKSSVKRVDVQARLIALLELLKRYSCKYVGASFMCKNTIASKLEVSYKTVQRLVKKLEALGMIKQVAMKRKRDMLQTANAIVIVPAEEEKTDKKHTEMTDKCPSIKTTTNLKQKINNIKETETDLSNDNEFDCSYLKKSIPNAIYKAFKPFFVSSSEMYAAYGTLIRAKASINKEIMLEEHTHDYIDTLKASILHWKKGKVRNLYNYLFSAFQATTAAIQRRENRDFILGWLEN